MCACRKYTLEPIGAKTYVLVSEERVENQARALDLLLTLALSFSHGADVRLPRI